MGLRKRKEDQGGERKGKESRDEPEWYMLVTHVANSRICHVTLLVLL